MKSFIAAGRPVGGDPRGVAVENAPVDAVGVVVGLEQERQQRRHQDCRCDPSRAVDSQVAGDLTGAHRGVTKGIVILIVWCSQR